jgi:hypothetical protein
VGRHSKKLQMQDAQILKNEAYKKYTAVTKDEAQHSRWAFYEAATIYLLKNIIPFFKIQRSVMGEEFI